MQLQIHDLGLRRHWFTLDVRTRNKVTAVRILARPRPYLTGFKFIFGSLSYEHLIVIFPLLQHFVQLALFHPYLYVCPIQNSTTRGRLYATRAAILITKCGHVVRS